MNYQTIARLYGTLAKPVFFKLDPEMVHDTITVVGGLLGKYAFTKTLTGYFFDYENFVLEQKVNGIRFKSPVGLSAGFDKNANLVDILPYVSFGFAEIGSITFKPYKGNPKPRLYRLPKSQALVVYYGLKNIGVKKIIQKLKTSNIPQDFPISISIAKTNSSTTSTTIGGINDYYSCFKKVVEAGVGNLYTLNISCPNTFGGEPFTTPEKLDKLLKKINTIKYDKPLFVKMPINLAWNDFDKLLKICIKYRVSGVVIGNLNKNHKDKNIKDTIPEGLKGGISGKPTWDLSNALIEKTYKKYKAKLTIIGTGGIFSAEDAYTKIKKGATLVQLITGMIYQGPQLIAQINEGIVDLMKKDGYKNLSEAVGKEVK
ncbi:quinone-dependent dihydroorotate dehydrogenase [Candidatus Woesebacteria bacterium]|nr:MAG: quinone-dependent dihydroorotate dehydrogenase [Candidatus Woesebacteria bacterium]